MVDARVAARRSRTMTSAVGRVVVGSTRTRVLVLRTPPRMRVARGLTRTSGAVDVLMPTSVVGGIRSRTWVGAGDRLRISPVVGGLRRAAAVIPRVVVADVLLRATMGVAIGLRGIANG